MNTTMLAHRFFHEPDLRGEYARVNTSFQYYTDRDGNLVWRYYSYATCIAEIRRDKNNQLCLLISHQNYSSNTSKHLYELRRACPYPSDRVIEVPRVGSGFFYGDYCYIKGTYDFERELSNVSKLTEKELRKQDERKNVQSVIRMYDNYTAHFSDVTKEEKRLRKSAKVAKVIDIVAEKEQRLNERRLHVATPEELAKRAEQRAKKEARIQRRVAEYMGDGNTLEKLKAVFSRYEYYRRGRLVCDFDDVKNAGMREAMSEYRRMLNNAQDSHGRGLSYVWLDNDGNARTSQCCQAPKEDAVRLLKLWKHKQNIVGDKAGVYTVVENTDESVKIGCHVIPTWNIELLCNALNVA